MNKLHFKTILSVVLLSLLTVLLCSCTGSSIRKFKSAEPLILHKTDGNLTFISKELKGTKPVASSGNLELFYDSKTVSVAVRNIATKKWWYSLATDKKTGINTEPSILKVKAFIDGDYYILSSQQDSVAKGTFEEKTNEDKTGVIITYKFDVEKNNVSVPVEFYLEDGCFCCRVDCENIQSSDDVLICGITLMDFFGCGSAAEESDYILVPDNCGALFYPSKLTEESESRSYRVYGDEKDTGTVMPAYGIRSGENAFVAVIEKGDTQATINLNSDKKSGCFSVGPTFTLRETELKQGRNEQIYVSEKAYDGEIKICYCFLSGQNANYSGMSISCREQLIRNGFLSSSTVSVEDSLPFVLSVLATDNTIPGQTAILTTFEQLQDMLSFLKGKGFGDICVKYRNALSGGVNQVVLSQASFQVALGSSEKYSELVDYMSAQSVDFFPDVNLTSAASGSVTASYCSGKLTGGVISSEKTNSFSVNSNYSCLSAEKIADNTVALFGLADKYNLTGVGLNDSATRLFADSFSDFTRWNMAETIKEETVSLGNIGSVMVIGGNMFCLKGVSLISGISLNAKGETEYYKSVPFVQMVIHGTVDYSCEPINYSSDYESAMLKAVEYGALPEFEWCYEEIPSEDDGDDSTYSLHSYSQWGTTAYVFYEKANIALGDLRERRMTAHYEVRSGLFCTEYGDSVVYVNYNKKSARINGITVPARDFIRVN